MTPAIPESFCRLNTFDNMPAMSNPFQITFTLKQHTPIIHFQHDQEGATLRASEVKPKLDRFLYTVANNRINDRMKSNKENSHALSYKIRFFPVKTAGKLLDGNYGCFLAQWVWKIKETPSMLISPLKP